MNVAIIQNNTVINVIVCDSLDLAKFVTGINEVIDADKHKAYLGYIKINDVWCPPSPFPSWILDLNSRKWNPPIPQPEDGQLYDWDENSLSWVPYLV